MIKVSVIVPVYNTEVYLRKCLDSLVNQTLKEIEIIVVNDGTKDDSQMIIDEYAKKYPGILVPVVQENQGLSSARNTGITIAKGEYLGFVDSDDWVNTEMFEKLYDKASLTQADIVVCDTLFVYDDKEVRISSGVKYDVSEKESVKRNMNTIFPAAWNKIYRKSLLNGEIKFKPGIWFEDVEFLYRLFPKINSISVVHQPYVHYLQRSGAITKTFNTRLFDYLDNWVGILHYYLEKGYYDEYKNELEYSCVRYILGTFLKNSLMLESKELFEQAVHRAFSFVNEHFPNYRRNSYFYKSGFKGFQLLLMSKGFIFAIRKVKSL